MITKKTIIIPFLILAFFVGLFVYLNKSKRNSQPPVTVLPNAPKKITHPLQIEEMRKKEYQGSEIKIEQELSDRPSYNQYLASYQSEGLKIYGLLTVPKAAPPVNGWPVIIFNHGYIPPEQYQTIQSYASYLDVFARNSYIVFKPDYRGNANLEGKPEGAYFSPAYTTDVLNAVLSMKRFDKADPKRIGMWGHSMGGNITLRSMVVSKDIKAGVIWAGVVGSYESLLNRWRRGVPFSSSDRENRAGRPSRSDLIKQFGDFNSNPSFWNSISPILYVSGISGPLQLHHSFSDTTVPFEFSQL